MCDLQSAENIVQTMHKIFSSPCSISDPFCRRVGRGCHDKSPHFSHIDNKYLISERAGRNISIKYFMLPR